MSDRSSNLNPPTSPTADRSTCSAASAGGPSLSSGQGGLPTGLFGQALAPVSRSVRRGSGGAPTTSGTCGPRCDGSSASAALQRSLESRLRVLLGGRGSPEYVLTWKHWAMPSGVPICALRASARRTSDSDFSGWPTPRTPTGGPESRESKAKRGSGHVCLQTVAALAGWATPTTQDAANTAGPSQFHRNSHPLNVQAVLAGWDTPTVGDTDKATPRSQQGLPRQVHGRTAPSSGVGIERRGVLNPDLPRWLMGFPAEWGSCGATAMQSCRKLPRRLCGRSSKPNGRGEETTA